MNGIPTASSSVTADEFATGASFQSAMAGAIAVVASGAPSGATSTVVATVASYSANPPSIVLSLDPGIVSTGGDPFGVSVLSTEHLDAVAGNTELTDTSFPMDGGRHSRVDDALVYLGCRTELVVHDDDAALLIATVDDIDIGSGAPLLWINGAAAGVSAAAAGNRTHSGFPDAMASVASAVYVVTGWDEHHRPRGFTATSVFPHGSRARSVAVSIDHAAYSHDALAGGERIGVNILSAGQTDLAELFASKRADKFQAADWARRDGLPVLADGAGYALCRISRTVSHGDHTLVVAVIEAAVVSGEPPLLYWRRGFGPPAPLGGAGS